MKRFAELLDAHLRDGTGHQAPGQPGSVWTPKEFAGRIGCSDRNVRNWITGRALPENRWLTQIELVLFGANQACEREKRTALRAAWESDRTNSSFSFKAFGSPPGYDPFSNMMPDDAGDSYETLFRDDLQRDRFEDILSWLKIGHESDGDWRELFCTMQERGSCIGIAFLSLYRPLGWWFGSYFGLLKDWREDDRALKFLTFIVEQCEVIEKIAGKEAERAKGIVFEMERFDEKRIQTINARCDTKKWQRGEKMSLSKDEKLDVEAVLRIFLYTHANAFIVCTESDEGPRFMNYVQPAMDPSLDPANEVDLWLMVYAFEPLLEKMEDSVVQDIKYRLNETETNEIFNLIYKQLFPAAYAREYYGGNAVESGVGFNNYSQYCGDVRRRVETSLKGRPLALVGHNILPREARRLVSRYGRRRFDLDE